MKYRNPRTVWKCALCDIATVVLHELCYGHGNRTIAVQYSIQSPLCTFHHQQAHKHKAEYQEKLFEWLGIDMYTTIRAFNDKRLRTFLEINKDHCEEKINSLEVWR